MSKYSRLSFIFCILFGLLIACNLTSGGQNQEFPSTASNISTPFSPTATDTPPAPSPLPPTPTPNMINKTIAFRTGGTSSYLQEAIKTGENHTYTLQAGEGQTLIVTVSSSNNDVFLGVKGSQDGQELVSTENQTSYWVGILPATQEYVITLTTDNPATDYFLSVEVPANIEFQAGADTVTIEGYIDIDPNLHPNVMTRVRYLANGLEGQTMTVELTSPNLDNLSIGVYGQEDGQRYIAYHVKNNGGTMPLPLTQGYYIDVYSTGGVSTDFTLEISIK